MNDARRSEKEFLSVVMPLYREGSHPRTVLAAVRDALATVNVLYEFVLVDDGSSDDTWAIIKEEAKTCQMLRWSSA